MFFFVKQKTAYEMRISDGSSDVCSSDLPETDVIGTAAHASLPFRFTMSNNRPHTQTYSADVRHPLSRLSPSSTGFAPFRDRKDAAVPLSRRSEEHTSELQSLMRISYAVFCLKKKKTKQKNHQTTKAEQNTT